MSNQRVSRQLLQKMGFEQIKFWDGDDVAETDDAIFGIDSQTKSSFVFPFTMTAEEAVEKIQKSRKAFGKQNDNRRMPVTSGNRDRAKARHES